MIKRRTTLGLLATAVAMPRLLLPREAMAAGAEPEILVEKITAGTLPPMAERIPKTPRVVNLAAMGRTPGSYGGAIRILIGSQKDIRVMYINGYARLVGYDEKLNFQPDILEACDIDGEKVFTFRIREGHRWSDGSPVTSEDFRYTWEDVVLDQDLRKGGVQQELLAEGKPPRFEVLDARTVRYSWDAPNPDFLPNLASALPLTLLLPAAYMKQFHKKYQTEEQLKAFMKQYRVKKWVDLHIKMSRQSRPDNPELPSLDPWVNTTVSPAEQFIFDRNPYFHRVDENGVQLPYIDRVVLNVSSPGIIAAKTGGGEADLQSQNIDFVDYAFIKDSEKRYPVKVKLWKRTQGSRVALLPNLNYGDPVWQGLLRDVRVRRALSLAIDRREINMVAFYGLGKESADTVLPESPLYKPEYAAAWSQHDPEQANLLLDAVGLTQRDDDGMRLLPDGRVAQIVVETAGESTLETDVLELITDHWAKIGIPLFIKTSQREVFRNRTMGGEIMMSMWFGLANGVATADMSPGQLAPSADDQLQWPVWGMHYLSLGQFGHAPELPEAQKLVDLLKEWRRTADTAGRTRIWHEMLSIYTDQVYSIGMVNATLQPILHAARMQNVPEQGLYGFDPTCFFGIYMPDTFWLGDKVS
ncbi:peptide ABC transporter substrate-binding protein [Rhizobium sp. Leaf384]|uniref:ABC transporter substrate-binding protein n=1 Tax=unclassified Rhizobium TaxID=2613769 RepID=UPI000714E74E|nr:MULTISPECIES: ABC transporter substrate-binding protein [unclassified Rhizobium]KQS77045.1 peptide ABC transporter substrate-binding protein [Rhizobium sp. Leaf384]KQS78316.1 peptide ABC transporter substrate-binding protein [Rhizobium sp. Leaf383]